jgi:hypothetical protein
MNALGTAAALTAIMAAGIIYGTDVFCAIVQRPALTRLDDATVAATLAWLGLYLRIAAPVNRALTAAAIAHVTPANSRSLQSRWDSIIAPRALLMAVAVAGLATSAAIH